MTDLKRQMIEFRTLRDAARSLLEADIANLRADLISKSLSERMLDRVGESASQLLDQAGETAQNNRGTLAVLLGAMALWFARNPIMSLFSDDEDPDSQTGAIDGE
ncbi:MAG: hypothetical protein EP350_06955 [Alphaproteobacteria bacterium]|nr:MAG: hypothetical protein EP350_06955 [Alphaproteobacteria bacterium]